MIGVAIDCGSAGIHFPLESTEPTMKKRILATRQIHQGLRFSFEEIEIQNTDPASPPIIRDIVRHPGAVVVLPITEDGRIVLIRNYRPAVDATLWELCAGTLDQQNEPPADCAARELVEETGYRAETIENLGSFYTTPGLTDELMHAFLAKDLEFVGQSLEPGEEISVCVKGFDEIDEMIRSGELRDAKSMVAMMLFNRKYHAKN